MDTIARVWRVFYVQGWSVKKIVRELHVSRNTVRKILRSCSTDFEMKPASPASISPQFAAGLSSAGPAINRVV